MILFFDTETTGLPKNWKAPVTDLDNWPRLVQLAYLVYDFDGNLILSCNEIIKPNGFAIPEDASNVHGITTDIANQRGSKIEEVFELFSIHLKRAKVLVAHNMAYDEKIIGSEMIRLGMENTVDSKEKICTMESTVDLCKIDGPYGYKWPRLEELHRFLFNHDFDGAHDALADIQATAKCFWELKKRGVINLLGINWSPSTKKRIEELAKKINIENISEFNVPFLTLENNGLSIWRFFNIKNEIIHGEKRINYNELDFTKLGERESNIWEQEYCNFTNNLQEFTINYWNGWNLDENKNLSYKNKIRLFSNEIEACNDNLLGYLGTYSYAIYNSKEEDISKLIALCQQGDEDGRPEAPYYQTVFYLGKEGKVYLENNQLVFDQESCVPFLKIDAEGNSSWQFYNYEKDLFFGRLFEDHAALETEIKSIMINKSTELWQTDYYDEANIGKNNWNGWDIDNDGNLFFQSKFRVNIFHLKIDTGCSETWYPRILNSSSSISKTLLYCYDADHKGLNFEGYVTAFYIDSHGKMFFENNFNHPEEFDELDAWYAIAEMNAESKN